MARSTDPISFISNPLVTSTQLLDFKSTASPSSKSSHFATCVLTQAAGILLRLPQETIATAIVLLQRYLISHTPTSTDTSRPLHLISAASIYLSSKLFSIPASPRSLVNVYAFLTSPASSPLGFVKASSSSSPSDAPPPDPHSYYISEGTLDTLRLRVFETESFLLSNLGFNLHVALPHPLALTYLSALGVGHKKGPRAACD